MEELRVKILRLDDTHMQREASQYIHNMVTSHKTLTSDRQTGELQKSLTEDSS